MINEHEESKGIEEELPGMFGDIVYIIPVEDGDPDLASLLQGFSRSLIENQGIISLINTLPGDIFELTPEGLDVKLPRRMSGQAPISWFGQSPRALTGLPTPVFMPFTVVFFGTKHKVEDYRNWIDSHAFPLTTVAKAGGIITYSDFCMEALQVAFLNICDALKGKVRAEALASARKYIDAWQEPEKRELDFKVGGHNSVRPNTMALSAAGFEDIVSGPFKDINRGIGPYVEQISMTTQAILDERARIGEREPNQHIRRPPGLSLFSPAIYPHFHKVPLTGFPFSPAERKRFLTLRRALERQEGYMFEADTTAKAQALYGPDLSGEPKHHPMMIERAGELSLATECVATLASSEISAVIRLPNAVNRTAGRVRQFAQQYNARKTNDRKRIESFRRVQNAVTSSIPTEFHSFIEEAGDGIRLIADAHLEWMSLRGLPLCVQKDVTRIPVTPGNLFVDQVTPKNYRHISTNDFQEVLILSALEETDPISRFFDIAIGQFEPLFKERVRVDTVRVRNLEELVTSLNGFEGALMIFDGHGSHEPGKHATLHLLDEEVDTWTLQSIRPRVPPIVVLSACDTHAADRNHASTASGFLAAGARTVLGSVFPINAMDASSFVARLLYRIAEFVPSAHRLFGRSLSWMEIMGGMIRMQLLTDFCRRLEQKNVIDHETYEAVHTRGNTAINGFEAWPFEVVIADLMERGVDKQLAWREIAGAAANSTAISYLQLGRPETIMVHPEDGFPDDKAIAGAKRLST